MVETGHPYVTSMRQNLSLNLPDKYETVLGSVRHRRASEDRQTRSTKSDTKFDGGIFWNHNVSEFPRVRQGEHILSVHPSTLLYLGKGDRSIYGRCTRGCVDALWVIEAHQSAWQLSYWIQNAIFQVSTYRSIPHQRQSPTTVSQNVVEVLRMCGDRIYERISRCLYGDRAPTRLSRRLHFSILRDVTSCVKLAFAQERHA